MPTEQVDSIIDCPSNPEKYFVRRSLRALSVVVIAAGLWSCGADEQDSNVQTFDAVWRLVAEKYVNQDFNGLDWPKVRETFRPMAADARTRVDLYWRVLNPMLSLLESSHTAARMSATVPGGIGEKDKEGTKLAVMEPSLGRCLGLWMVFGRAEIAPKVISVDSGSPSDRAGVRANWRLASYPIREGDLEREKFTFIDRGGKKHVVPVSSLVPSDSSGSKSVLAKELKTLNRQRQSGNKAGAFQITSLGLRVMPGVLATAPTVALVESESAAARAGVTPGSTVIEIRDARITQRSRRFEGTFRAPSGGIRRMSEVYSCPASDIASPREARSVGAGGLYLRFDNFRDGLAEWVGRVLEKQVAFVVLDLRRNTGGSSQEMEQVLGSLLDDGTIVAFARRRGEEKALRARGSDVRSRVPVAVLISPLSASAAEVTADALRRHSSARLYGATTAGEVEISSTYLLPDGGAISVAEEALFLPDGSRLEGIGVSPDVKVTETLASAREGRDLVLERAIVDLERSRSGSSQAR